MLNEISQIFDNINAVLWLISSVYMLIRCTDRAGVYLDQSLCLCRKTECMLC